ncbi:MAG TPA: helix-turn-helix domain-containing protein [Acidimicrobiia bacterium]
MTGHTLSPIERTITRLHNRGASLSEIATRVGKKPGTVSRIMEMTRYRIHGDGATPRPPGALSPLERVVLRLRERGESYGEIGIRLARSSRRIREIEKYAQFKLSRA